MADSAGSESPDVLENKRSATRYQVLVEIAARQPAVSQGEIAETIGVTSQAVSDYVRDLVESGYVDKGGRGRYEVTKEGVDWLISRTDDLETYLERVNSDVLGSVEVDAAIVLDDVAEGREVGLVMRDGILHANPAGGTATAVTVMSANKGEAVGVADFEGVVEHDTGSVSVLPIPTVTDDDRLNPDAVSTHVPDEGLVAVAGTEAYALVSRSDTSPDLRFGTEEGVAEAAMLGLDVLLVAVTDEIPRHTSKLRDRNVPHRVLDSDAF
jgi:putative transcriptional regulator